jgi:hypothetical protein
MVCSGHYLGRRIEHSWQIGCCQERFSSSFFHGGVHDWILVHLEWKKCS